MTIRKVLATILLALTALQVHASEGAALIPYPNKVSMGQGKAYCISHKTPIIASESLRGEAAYLRQRIKQDHMMELMTSTTGKGITLAINSALADNAEHYTLSIDKHGIRIEGATEQAVFEGIQTLCQWMLTKAQHTDKGLCVAPVSIDDTPRYGYRAMMLDPARHFLPLADVKRFVDEMARYKFNILQMHLADDQGWRLEIKSHPELTASCPHYTQEEMRELVDYAARQHIQIVPEIDIPGHTYGLLTHHKELCCRGVNTDNFGSELRTDVMLCAAKEATYGIVTDILREVCTLFPTPYIHLGGDESLIEKNWGKCEDCQQLKAQLGYTTNDQLMGHFFDHFWPLLRSQGKRPILWMEMDNLWPPATRYLFPYPKDVTLVTWRNALTPTAIQLSAQGGNDLLMAPGEHCYFDYPQWKNDLPEFNNWGMPILPLEAAFRWNPSYPDLGLPSDHIRGVMCTLWAEAINDIHRAFYMAYPRAMALAERGWCDDATPNYDNYEDFLGRLHPLLADMIRRGIPFRVPFEAYSK